MKQTIFLIISFLVINLEEYQAQSWAQLGTGSNSLNCQAGTFNGGGLHALLSDAQGNIYVSGSIYDSTGRSYIAKWNGNNWIKLGNSIDTNLFLFPTVMSKDSSGNIYATGPRLNGLPNHVMKWDGFNWIDLCATSSPANSGRFWTLCSDPDGNLYTAGSFTNASGRCFVSKWNGSSWSPLGNGPYSLNPGGTILSICSDPGGNIYAAGLLNNAGFPSWNYYVAKWDGTSWSELGTGVNGLIANDRIYSITSDAASNIYAGGAFKNDSGYRYVAKWNGISWSELGGIQHGLKGFGDIYSIITDGNKVYAAGGLLDSTLDYRYVAKWDGNSWSDLGNLNATNNINSLCTDPAGNVYATGVFVNNQDYVYVAKYGSAIVGIASNKQDATNNLKVWPNPSSGKFMFQLNESESKNYIVEVVNLMGQIVHAQSILQHDEASIHEIMLENHISGMYTLRVYNGRFYKTEKLLIK